MNPLPAIDFLRSIDFPADPIESHYTFHTATADDARMIDDALRALRPTNLPHAIDDYSDSDFDALDRILYPND